MQIQVGHGEKFRIYSWKAKGKLLSVLSWRRCDGVRVDAEDQQSATKWSDGLMTGWEEWVNGRSRGGEK